ncbi:ABC transporter permease [Ruminococcus gauvreauii]|uniref:ABC transporter permease n=2 Tax=Ruminococcus gauvreauii TaxID=438033 RepID=A0ABY5VHM5_9FIRM|nr:ABC transporter permease [Ruminococcus gauvreauii]UWP59466.1 ABC transporter permease [Ruminococcus gauvreauii]
MMVKSKKGSFSVAEFYSKFGIVLIFVLLFVIMSVVNRNFISGVNLRNVVRQVVVITILACGEQLMLISGMVDLSPGRVLAFAGTLSAYCMMKTGNLFLALVVGLACGLLFGAINGALITAFDIPPFIATLASMQMADGAIMAFTGGQNYSNLPASFNFLGQGYIGFIPFPVVIMILVLIITYIILAWTPMGRSLYAIGGNQAAALASGIRVKRSKFFACAFGGVCTGLAGILLMARMSSGQPAAGEGMEMDAITAVIVGGTSMSGGVGNILNTIVGSLIIGIIKNFMNLQNINSSFQDIVLGILICVAVIIDVQVRKANTK